MAGELFGFIGLGNMGTPMAGRLIDAGYGLCVYDTNQEAVKKLVARGARAAKTAVEVASAAQTIFVSLPTPAIVHEVALGPNGVTQGNAVTTLIDLSTTGPGMAKIVANGLSAKNITLVDCPVSGGMYGAAAGTLAVMVSCPKETFATLEPVLKVFGKLIFTGEAPGLAQSAKLINNLLSATAITATSEAMAMGVKAGLDPKVLLDVVNAGSGRNSATVDKFPRSILTGGFDYGFSTGLCYKDVRLCIEEADGMGIPMIVGNAVKQLLGITMTQYGAASDFTNVAKLLETWAGVEVRG